MVAVVVEDVDVVVFDEELLLSQLAVDDQLDAIVGNALNLVMVGFVVDSYHTSPGIHSLSRQVELEFLSK